MADYFDRFMQGLQLAQDRAERKRQIAENDARLKMYKEEMSKKEKNAEQQYNQEFMFKYGYTPQEASEMQKEAENYDNLSNIGVSGYKIPPNVQQFIDLKNKIRSGVSEKKNSGYDLDTYMKREEARVKANAQIEANKTSEINKRQDYAQQFRKDIQNARTEYSRTKDEKSYATKIIGMQQKLSSDYNSAKLTEKDFNELKSDIETVKPKELKKKSKENNPLGIDLGE